MADDVLIDVDGASKRFCRSLKRAMFYTGCDIARNMLNRPSRTGLRRDEFWAIDDVRFQVRRGECIGLIGPNGAGKSTLLKMLTGILVPDRGSITVRGRVGPLIELGAGFHPVLTGRENIYVNAAILGMGKKDVDSKIDQIIAFAEIEEAIDTPVRYYSSGMYVRLGFAIAVHVRPDILLVDEVLAVGDMGFRAKCYNVMAELARESAVVFVSHNMAHIARIADRVIVLDHGRIHTAGDAEQGVLAYHRICERAQFGNRAGNGDCRVEQVDIQGVQANTEHHVGCRCGESLIVALQVQPRVDIPQLTVNLDFFNLGGMHVAECGNYVYPHPVVARAGERLEIRVTIDPFTLNPGLYRLGVILGSEDLVTHYDWMDHVATLEVSGSRIGTAPQQFTGKWETGPVGGA